MTQWMLLLAFNEATTALLGRLKEAPGKLSRPRHHDDDETTPVRLGLEQLAEFPCVGLFAFSLRMSRLSWNLATAVPV